jgi:hypothetical protein
MFVNFINLNHDMNLFSALLSGFVPMVVLSDKAVYNGGQELRKWPLNHVRCSYLAMPRMV